jgi:hypothetical protein
MSASGHKRANVVIDFESASPLEAGIALRRTNRRFGPTPDASVPNWAANFADHVGGALLAFGVSGITALLSSLE